MNYSISKQNKNNTHNISKIFRITYFLILNEKNNNIKETPV